jgi:hypothetical protein
MTITGTIKKFMPVESGISNRTGNPWQNQTIIIEQGGEYPKTIAIVVDPKKLDINQFAEGEPITAHINIQSNEWNGRYITNVNAWKIERNQ